MLRLVLSCSVLLMSLAVADGWPEWGIRDNSDAAAFALKIDDGDPVALEAAGGDSQVFSVI